MLPITINGKHIKTHVNVVRCPIMCCCYAHLKDIAMHFVLNVNMYHNTHQCTLMSIDTRGDAFPLILKGIHSSEYSLKLTCFLMKVQIIDSLYALPYSKYGMIMINADYYNPIITYIMVSTNSFGIMAMMKDKDSYGCHCWAIVLGWPHIITFVLLSILWIGKVLLFLNVFTHSRHRWMEVTPPPDFHSIGVKLCHLCLINVILYDKWVSSVILWMLSSSIRMFTAHNSLDI